VCARARVRMRVRVCVYTLLFTGKRTSKLFKVYVITWEQAFLNIMEKYNIAYFLVVYKCKSYNFTISYNTSNFVIFLFRKK